jgi:hypothetical protein
VPPWLGVPVRTAIRALDDADWTAATRQNGEPRDKAYVVEITHAKGIDISGWPAGSRLLVRKEPLHPGAQQTIDDINGCRFTAFLTDQTDTDLARLDTGHRGHARVEDRIRTGNERNVADSRRRRVEDRGVRYRPWAARKPASGGCPAAGAAPGDGRLASEPDLSSRAGTRAA